MTDRRDQDYVAYVGQRLERLRRVAFLLCHDWHRADDLVQITVTACTCIGAGRALRTTSTDT